MSSRVFLSVSDNQSLSLPVFSSSSLPSLLFFAGVFKRTVNCPVTVNTIQPDEIVKNARHFTSTDPGVELLLKIHMNVRVSVFHCLFRENFGKFFSLFKHLHSLLFHSLRLILGHCLWFSFPLTTNKWQPVTAIFMREDVDSIWNCSNSQAESQEESAPTADTTQPGDTVITVKRDFIGTPTNQSVIERPANVSFTKSLFRVSFFFPCHVFSFIPSYVLLTLKALPFFSLHPFRT